MYTLMTVPFLWLFHCGTFFWGVVWPYHYSVSKSSGRVKYYHISAVSTSVILPLIVVIAVQLNGGFGLGVSVFPTCGSVFPTELFYAFLLPADFLIITGTILLIVTFWSIADMVSNPISLCVCV